MNPLLNLTDTPQFDQFKAEHITPAMQTAMADAREMLNKIKAQEVVSWDNTVEALADLGDYAGRIWGVVSHIHSVADSPEWRDAYNALIPEVTLFFTEISQDLALYQRYKSLRGSSEYETLNYAKKKKLNNDLRDFVLSGVELPPDLQMEFATLQQKGAELSAAFSQNVLDATDAFSLHIENKEDLAGLPETSLAMLSAFAKEQGKTGFVVGLKAPHYLAIMQFADNRALREQIYRAYAIRASELDDAKRNNAPLIDEILQIAAREAQILGFENYAALSLETKMADTPDNVIAFLRDMASRAKPFALRDLDELKTFAGQHGVDELKAWDIAYFSEKLRQEKYSFSEEEVRQYFPLSKVLNGLFQLINELYGVEFTEENRPVWHNSVRYFNLMKKGEKIGGVYLDLYARGGKKGGAWMNDYCSRRALLSGKTQLPQAYIVCNFAPPETDGEARLSHSDILTLFHECGHSLHHLLTQIGVSGVSGIEGVEWDAVELPSQFMENFAWEYDVLKNMSCHKQTQDRLPESLYQKMRAAKNFQTGLFVVRQMEFALFDLLIYKEKTQPCNWQGVLDEVRAEVAVVPMIPENRFAQSFSHIFAGGYSAGYYSYIWAEVLSADVYAAFVEENDRAKTGKRFWQEILSQGGSRSALDNFRAFRGRDPKPDALLKHLGLVE
ncbi:MAG: M3 family metallopeptidase [Neisseriaceae bacterium]|nr:M3 family metallopeptidase [Neisseriaceae bacterium]